MKSKPTRAIIAIVIFSNLFFFNIAELFAQAQVKVRDIARVGDNREYQVIGYGLVTGLDGTGDKGQIALQMMRGLLQNMGMEVANSQMNSNNMAAVIVTAMLPSYVRAGESINIIVSSMGDAKSLQGGILLPTLLKGGDGNTYAVAQGQVSIGGLPGGNIAGGRQGGQVTHLTVGQIPNGAIIERAVEGNFARNGYFNVLLHEKNLDQTRKVKEAIDRLYGSGWANIVNPGDIRVVVPLSMSDDPITFAANIENIPISIDEPNRVVINERTGTVIIGNNVRISRVVIAHNGIKMQVASELTAQTRGSRGTGPEASLMEIEGETTVETLVEALNAVGATPGDIIAIFQTIHAAGALHGELKLM